MNRIPRIFTQSLPPALSEHLIEGDTAHYLLKVLRVKAGQLIELVDGRGHGLRAQVESVGRRDLVVQTQALEQLDTQSPSRIHLYMALIKPERFEWTLQKSVELGVDQITPVLAERCDGRLADKLEKKTERWMGILISAFEQSRSSHLPRLNPLMQLSELPTTDTGWLLDPSADGGFEPAGSNISLLIGPEGGWTENELADAKTCGWRGATLGPRILRAETAAITTLGLCQYLCGDLR